jgi:hypothetical protein
LACIGARLDAERIWANRKGKQSGVWFVCWRSHHEGGNYKQEPVGVANDINDNPADGILTFEQTVGTAREAVEPEQKPRRRRRPGSYRAIGRRILRQGTRRSRKTPVPGCGATFLVKKSAAIRKLRKMLLSHRCICSLKDQEFSNFLDPSPPFELRPYNGVSLRQSLQCVLAQS